MQFHDSVSRIRVGMFDRDSYFILLRVFLPKINGNMSGAVGTKINI